MLYLLKRHPLPVRAHFRHSLVLTYALPRAVLEPLLPPGLQLDLFEDFGFVAIALVQTEGLRPAFFPAALGQDFFLSGYRIFTRYTTSEGRHLRGLRILRSDTNRRLMAFSGNLLTHYHYRLAQVKMRESAQQIELEVHTPNAEADLVLRADLSSLPAPLPSGSPFPDLQTAQRFAGPLPYTFDYEKQTHSLILIKGVRKRWDPQPVRVEVEKATFFDNPAFRGTTPILANAFYISDIPYRWLRGRREALPDYQKQEAQP
jgi:hypothetical protein